MAFFRVFFYFFLSTSVADCPRLSPLGMIYSDGEALYIVTDKRKSVYSDLKRNARVELAAFNPATRKWVRISGDASEDDTCVSRELALSAYPLLGQKYPGEQEAFLAIYQIHIEAASIN